VIENGNLVVYKNSNLPSVVWRSNQYSNNTQKVCIQGAVVNVFSGWGIYGFNNSCDIMQIQDDGLIVFWENGIKRTYTEGIKSSCPTTTSTTTTQSTTTAAYIPCIGDTIYSGQCLYPGQALCSKNGCFRMIIENSVLIAYRMSDMSVAWKQPIKSINACMAITGVFAELIEFARLSDAVLTDDGQLIVLLGSTGGRGLGNFGIASTCNSSSICSQSVIDVGECFFPEQVKVSCNGCFKMVLEGGDFVVYHNNAPGLPPVLSYPTWGITVKACGGIELLEFYTTDGTKTGGVGPPHDHNGVIAKVLDNGQIVFAAKNASIANVFTFGNATICSINSASSSTPGM
jgi:hypothetical protein